MKTGYLLIGPEVYSIYYKYRKIPASMIMNLTLPLLASLATFVCAVACAENETPTHDRTTIVDSARSLLEQEALAQGLRAATAQEYNFTKATLSDVLRRLSQDANVTLVSVPEDSLEATRLITLSMQGSPFKVIESICKANGLMLSHETGRWHVLPANDNELVGITYYLKKETFKHEDLMADLSSILDLPPENVGGKSKAPEIEGAPKVTWKADTKELYVVGTRLQHKWVSGYLTGARLRPE